MNDQPNYPYSDGDVTVLGPEIFASKDGEVISWRGENYSRQSAAPLEPLSAPRSVPEAPGGELAGRNGDSGVQAGSGEPDELTVEEARGLVDELGLRLYRAQDALAFVEECCVIAEREQKPITVADVREWLKGARCGRQLAADVPAATQATEAQETP